MSEQVRKNTILVGLKEGVDPKSILPANVTESLSDHSNIKIERLHSIKSVVEKAKTENASILEANISDEEIFNNEYERMSEVEKRLYRTYEIKIEDNVNVEALLDKLRKSDGIEYAELDHPLTLYMNPNDPRYPELYGLKNMQCSKAWDISQGEGIVVAVIDSGVDYNHPDIKENMWIDENGKHGYDFSDNDSDPMDDPALRGDGHGTHVAGTIAAVGNNRIGVIGVAPKAKIMALKIFPNGTDSVAARALRYAVDHGAKVLNNSWGPRDRRPSNPVVEQALDYVYEKGAIAVFAAGNSNDDAQYYSPANYEKTIAVSAVNKDDKRGYGDDEPRGYFSNYGEVVEVAAPGVDILSLKVRSNNYTNSFSGTSMASPHVSGLVALILSKKPTLTFEEVKKILKESSDEINTDKYIGSGRVNAYKSLNHNLLTGITPSTRELTGVR